MTVENFDLLEWFVRWPIKEGKNSEFADGQLAMAAAVLALPDEHRGQKDATLRRRYFSDVPRAAPLNWPFHWEDWNETKVRRNRICQLKSAQAMLQLEIERLQSEDGFVERTTERLSQIDPEIERVKQANKGNFCKTLERRDVMRLEDERKMLERSLPASK